MDPFIYDLRQAIGQVRIHTQPQTTCSSSKLYNIANPRTSAYVNVFVHIRIILHSSLLRCTAASHT
jgi:hypothetical protein